MGWATDRIPPEVLAYMKKTDNYRFGKNETANNTVRDVAHTKHDMTG
jgi:hypothetical protein